MLGEHSIAALFPAVSIDDYPFAQDQVGDQYILRGELAGYSVWRLDAETGQFEAFAPSLDDFIKGISTDIEDYLNVSLGHRLEPGFLLHAHPPFCSRESASGGSSLRPVPADELNSYHSGLAKSIGALSDGESFQIELTE